MLKGIKLTGAALITAFVFLTYQYFFNYSWFVLASQCWKYTTNIFGCLSAEPIEFIADINGLRYEGNRGNYIDDHIFYYGVYEKPALFFLRDIMTSAYLDQGVFLDIGANTGQHTLFMSRHAKEIHAFEPWAPALKRLRRHIEINRLNNVTIHGFGLGNENSKQPFYVPPNDNLGMGSFVKESASLGQAEELLEIRVGDDVIAKAGVASVDLIKMDIEGYERLALSGLERTLRKHRPIVAFELSANPKSPLSIKNNEELRSLFPEKYEFLIFSDRSDPMTGTYVLDPISGLLRFDQVEQYDLVAYPIEKQAFIKRSPQNRE